MDVLCVPGTVYHSSDRMRQGCVQRAYRTNYVWWQGVRLLGSQWVYIVRCIGRWSAKWCRSCAAATVRLKSAVAAGSGLHAWVDDKFGRSVEQGRGGWVVAGHISISYPTLHADRNAYYAVSNSIGCMLKWQLINCWCSSDTMCHGSWGTHSYLAASHW